MDITLKNQRNIAAAAVILAVVFGGVALFDGQNGKRLSHKADGSPRVGIFKSKSSTDWVPNETTTGNILAANFAQDQRNWALANLYLEKLNDNRPADPSSALRMMLLALGAGQFDRAGEYAHVLEKLQANPPEKVDPALQINDAQDLASLVLMAQSVRAGDLAGAEKKLMSVKSPALTAFVQPVIISWLKAGQKQSLDGPTEGLSLLQALHRGLAAEWAGQRDVANKVFDSLARVPLTPEGALVIAAYNIRQGRTDQARAALGEALRINPQNTEAKAMLDALNQGQSPQLKPEWSYHLQGVTAGTALALRDLAQMMTADRAADSALLFAQMGRMIRNDVPGLSLLVGAIFMDQRRFDDAAAVFATIQPKDIDYSEAQIHLSDLKVQMKQGDAAIKILEDLMRTNPSPRVAYALGEIYRDNGNSKGAVSAYDQAITLSGGKADDELWSVYYVRAMAYDDLGQWDKAEADLKTALSYRPDNPHVLNYLGYSYADKNINMGEAREMVMKALVHAPTDPYITDSLGWVYFRQGDMEQALALLERAVSLKPYDPVLNDHLGDVYNKIGRTLEARYQWRRAMDYADATKDAKLIETLKTKLETASAPN